MQEELHAGSMTVLVEMVNAASVEGRRTTDDAVDLYVCLLKENDELDVSNCELQIANEWIWSISYGAQEEWPAW